MFAKHSTLVCHVLENLKKRYQTISGKPGFTQEAFELLKNKSDPGTNEKKIPCALFKDEIEIRKHEIRLVMRVEVMLILAQKVLQMQNRQLQETHWP